MSYVNAHFDESFSEIKTGGKAAGGTPKAGLGARLAAWFRAYVEADRQSAQLARMSDYELRDLGVSRAQLGFEIESPLTHTVRGIG
jgi:uncharacterized protein YjiS (DUF1127 family)